MLKYFIILTYLKLNYGLILGLCSTSNVGSDEVTDQFMSNGYCKTHCISVNAAYGIVQGSSCWCSNDLPTSQTSMSNCQQECPGYPSENCAKLGYYGYIDLNDANNSEIELPSSTQSSTTTSSTSSSSSSPSRTNSRTSSSRSSSSRTSTTTSSSSPSSTSPTSSSSSEVSTESSSEIVSSSSISSSTSESLSTAVSESQNSEDSSITQQPSIIVSIKTVGGSEIVKTEFVTADPTPESTSGTSTSAASSEVPHNNKSFFDSKGKVAGTFTAVGVVVLGLVLGLIYCCFCVGGRKSDDYSDEEQQYSSDESTKAPVLITKNGSGNSINQSTPQSLKRDNSNKSIFSILGKESSMGGLTRNLSKKKLNSGMKPDSPNPITNEDFDGLQMFPITEFESSKHDSRLEPLFTNNNFSSQSLGDNIDYSRKLKIVNPEDD